MKEKLKQKAIELRQEGYTYQEISNMLAGELSVSWLRRNIAGTKKGKHVDPMLTELIAEATKVEGCSNYVAQGIIYKHNQGKHMTYPAIRAIKVKAKEIDDKCMFYPSWMDSKHPKESSLKLLMMADNVFNAIKEATDEYMASYPESNTAAVTYEIVGLAHRDYLPDPLFTRLERNTASVEQLLWRQSGDFTPWPLISVDRTDLEDKRWLTDVDTLADDVLDKIWAVEVPY